MFGSQQKSQTKTRAGREEEHHCTLPPPGCSSTMRRLLCIRTMKEHHDTYQA